MKAPIKWLRQYVNLDGVTPAYMAELLTSRGLEVAGIEYLGAEVSGVVVGRIQSMKRHEDSDHLWICQVEVGEGKVLQIVTGAQNLKEGDLVPAALHGSRLPGGVRIKKSKMRGEISEGMLCSGAELQIKDGDYPGAEVDGILVLTEAYPLGQDVIEALALDDIVLEVEPTANRPDWNSIIGVARELAAALDKPLKSWDVTVKEEGGRNISDVAQVTVQAPDLCPRYMARTASDIKIQPSPVWMRRALRAAGMRPINNVVDITNFVMLETGQPMHAFDFATVAQGHIVVRRSQPEERLTALNGESYALPADTLLIADPQKAVGLAGIMGGENSEITPNTRDVLFESAAFHGANIRRNSKAMGLNSDAASHFIKGVDIEGAAFALERACSLMEQLQAGKIDRGVIDVVAPGALERLRFDARPEKISALLGKDIPAQQMVDILCALAVPTTLQDGLLKVEVPHFRDDIEGEADIAEEVARVVGHNNIAPTLMRGDLMRGRLTPQQRWVDKLRQLLTGRGCFEALTYSFTGPAAYDKMGLAAGSPWRQSVALKNPFGEDNSLMRSTLLTGMLPAIAVNAKRKISQFRLFEIGNVHQRAQTPGELPQEEQKVCIAAFGMLEGFYTFKGMLVRVLEGLDISADQLRFEAGGEHCFHPGRKAILRVGDNVVGQMGEIHPDVAEQFGIPGRSYVAELSIQPLFDARRTEVLYQPLSRYPSVSRDLALLVARGIESAALADAMREVAGKLLASVELFDVYDGDKLPEGHKSLAYSLEFLSPDHTLTDQEVNEKIERILLALKERFHAELRQQ